MKNFSRRRLLFIIILSFAGSLIGACQKTASPVARGQFLPSTTQTVSTGSKSLAVNSSSEVSLAQTAYSPNYSYPLPPKTYRNSQGFTYKARGIASWYGHKFNKHRTSSGERYNMHEFTAAHRTLPLASWAEITNLENGHKIIVRINDRGPFQKKRLIDVSYAAARELGMWRKGTALVEVTATHLSKSELARAFATPPPLVHQKRHHHKASRHPSSRTHPKRHRKTQHIRSKSAKK